MELKRVALASAHSSCAPVIWFVEKHMLLCPLQRITSPNSTSVSVMESVLVPPLDVTCTVCAAWLAGCGGIVTDHDVAPTAIVVVTAAPPSMLTLINVALAAEPHTEP
jgi:hypothetical protein